MQRCRFGQWALTTTIAGFDLMPAIDNRSPFSAEIFSAFDAQAREQLILVVAASFITSPDGQMLVEQTPYPISAVDIHWDDPATTSVRYPGQLAFAKPYTDIIVTGHACAPKNKRVASMEISIQVADVAKTLVVFGDRFWKQGISGKVPSAPSPFERIPIVYERAFGGGIGQQNGTVATFDIRNPVGLGLGGRASIHPSVNTEVPNIEYPDDRQEQVTHRPRPAGLGALAPNWMPRCGYAGTYDELWLKEQAPLLPVDFNAQYFQFAPQDQRSTNVRAGDLVQVKGMTPEGIWRFQLPRANVPIMLVYADNLQRIPVALDSIHLEPDLYRVSLIGRRVICVRRNCAPLVGVVVGKLPPAWIRAHNAGKSYRSNKGVVPWDQG